MSSRISNPFRDHHRASRTRAQELKIEHVTYDKVHPSPRNFKAKELNIQHTTYDTLHSAQTNSSQRLTEGMNGDNAMYNNHEHLAIDKEHIKTYSASPPNGNISLGKRVKQYVHDRVDKKNIRIEREMPKIVLLYSTPVETPILERPKAPPSDEEIIAFLGMHDGVHKGRRATRSMDEEEEDSDEEKQARLNFEYQFGFEEEDGKADTHSSFDTLPILRNERYDDGKSGCEGTGSYEDMPRIRKNSKLLPPMPVHERSVAHFRGRSLEGQEQQRKRRSKHRRDMSATKIVSYLHTGTDKLHQKRISISGHLSASVRDSATRVARSYRELYMQRDNASDSSVDSFFCAGDSEATSEYASSRERSTSPWDCRSTPVVMKEKMCRLCHDRVSHLPSSGLCISCNEAYKRPQTKYFAEGKLQRASIIQIPSSKKKEILPPIPLIVRNPCSVMEALPANKRYSLPRSPSLHPLTYIAAPKIDVQSMPKTIPAIYAQDTVTVPATKLQHVAFQLQSPTLVQHTHQTSLPASPIRKRTRNKNVTQIWSKYHENGTKEQTDAEYDASRTCRDSLFYDLYDEVLNDYGGWDSLQKEELPLTKYQRNF